MQTINWVGSGLGRKGVNRLSLLKLFKARRRHGTAATNKSAPKGGVNYSHSGVFVYSGGGASWLWIDGTHA